MSRPRIVSRFDMLPIRWRLAVTSAILTFAILLAFAVVIGFFTVREMRSDFDSDIRQNADLIHDRVRIEQTVDGSYRIAGRDELVELASADDVVIRILNSNGDPIAQTTGAPDLGLPAGGLRDVGEYRVTSRELDRPFEETPVAYVQYAKSKDSLNGTIARLRVFLALGVLGGGALALLAGLAVARRAMEPITGPDGDRPPGRKDPRPRRRPPAAAGGRRDRRPVADAGRHAQRAGRGAHRDRGRARAPAAVRRRRVARAAHAAHEHPGEPRAARGGARGRGPRDRRIGAPLVAADAAARGRPAAARAGGRRAPGSPRGRGHGDGRARGGRRGGPARRAPRARGRRRRARSSSTVRPTTSTGSRST